MLNSENLLGREIGQRVRKGAMKVLSRAVQKTDPEHPGRPGVVNALNRTRRSMVKEAAVLTAHYLKRGAGRQPKDVEVSQDQETQEGVGVM
jgi:hypothetical protein